MNSVANRINEVEEIMDAQLWHACAGSTIQMPPLNSKVFYFPQGHAENAASENLIFGDSPKIPSEILCRISAIKYLADPDTDEVYAKIGLNPLKNQNWFDYNNDGSLGFDENQENPTSVGKTLTQSDANNCGGFSIPRFLAETIFPKLDYTAYRPVQTLSAKDIHGQIWKFRHIYRGTPKRHLLTTGWADFVNNKKLVAGDSILFLRSDNGDLCVGIRRGFKFLMNPKGKFSGESVIEAANLAANGDPFELLFYPGARTFEFCVKASTVMAAMRIQWWPGMRVKMRFETEDCSRISWFMGTVSSVNVVDQIRWPNSPWRLLQVSWDEPDSHQNVKRVNPWSVEMVLNKPPIHLSPFSPPRKKIHIPKPPDFPNVPVSIQGARHTNPQSASNHNPEFNKIQFFQSGILNHDPLRIFPTTVTDISTENNENEKLSCFLTLGNSYSTDGNKNDKKKPVFMLFGKPILTEQQVSESWSGDGSVESSSDETGPSLTEQKYVRFF